MSEFVTVKRELIERLRTRECYGTIVNSEALEELRAILARPVDSIHRRDDQSFNAKHLLARAAHILGLETDNTSWFEVVGEMEKATQRKRSLYTCIGKGGVYELLGESHGAGDDLRGTFQVIYRDVVTGQLYNRNRESFTERMELLP